MVSEWMQNKKPASAVMRILPAMLRDADDPDLAIFTRAAREVANEIIHMPPPALAARMREVRINASGEVDNETSVAHRIVRALDQWRRETRPKSLEAAAFAIEQARMCAGMVFGTQPRKTCPAMYEIRGGVVPMAGNSDRPWQLSPTWAARFLPGIGNTSLPGWTPPAWKSADGAVARRAK